MNFPKIPTIFCLLFVVSAIHGISAKLKQKIFTSRKLKLRTIWGNEDAPNFYADIIEPVCSASIDIQFFYIEF